MSGLLQRLAGQAMGAQSGPAAPRVRPAMSVHALMPLAAPPAEEVGPDPASPRTATARSAPEPRLNLPTVPASAAKLGNDTRVPLTIRAAGREPASNYPAQATPAAAVPPALDDARELEPIADRAPRPLLEGIRAVSTSTTVERATVRPLPVPQAINAARAESTEVHVHIGRIDVIAAPEPAPPKRNRATQVRETLPLADYLARRRRT